MARCLLLPARWQRGQHPKAETKGLVSIRAFFVSLWKISSSGQALFPQGGVCFSTAGGGRAHGLPAPLSWHKLHRILITHTVASACSELVARSLQLRAVTVLIPGPLWWPAVSGEAAPGSESLGFPLQNACCPSSDDSPALGIFNYKGCQFRFRFLCFFLFFPLF